MNVLQKFKKFFLILFILLFFPLSVFAVTTTWRVNNSTLLGGEVCSQWQANHAYSLGARCVCTVAYGTQAARAVVFECTTAGTSHATTQPTWDYTVGNTTADGPDTLVWTARSPGDGSWDNASCYLHYVLNHASPAAGDDVYVDDGHSETYGGAITVKGIDSATGPLRIYCVDKAADSLSTGALVVSTGAIFFTYSGYSYGVTYKAVSDDFQLTGNSWLLEGDGSTTLLWMATSGRTTYIGSSTVHSFKLINGNLRLDYANQKLYLTGGGKFEWIGGSLIAASGITNLFASQNSPFLVFIKDVDLTAVGSSNALVSVSPGVFYNAVFERCKLPSSFSPIVGTWPRLQIGKIRLHHCSDANNTYDFREDSPEGIVVDETTIVRTGGASDGTTPQSWKMTSGSIPDKNNHFALESPPIVGWTSATTEKTFTVECILDSATNLQNDEVWMELEYPANGTDGLGAVATDKCAQLGTPADKSASAGETWGDGGLINPNKFKCSVTVTSGKAGPITARVYLAKASTTIYVDPKITEH